MYQKEWQERKFWWQKNKKEWLLKKRNVAKIDNVDVNKILVSREESYGTKNSFKYFIGYNDNDVIRPLCIKLLQMSGYVRAFESYATMPFKTNNEQLL